MSPMDQSKTLLPIYQPPEDSPCCGPSLAPPAAEYERPGYVVCRYVLAFVDTAAGPVPLVSSRLDWFDQLGLVRARLGIFRNSYRISPGLYGVGAPGSDSPVLVTANYKLTFDLLRRDLASQNVWILVLDTRGINVWCASAHKTFGTEELLQRVKVSGLVQILGHRQLVVPQLGASGVDALAVRAKSGFEVRWGPLRTGDLGLFLAEDGVAAPAMRRLTFTLAERLVLAPVELTMAIKPSLVILLVLLLLSGLGPAGFLPAQAWARWLPLAVPAFVAGLLTGAVLVPALLPWLPFRAFYLKGLLAALPAAGAVIFWFGSSFWPEMLAQALICLVASSYLAMNFTGATPYASPSGVEKEMRSAIPVQILLALAIMILWVVTPFMFR